MDLPQPIVFVFTLEERTGILPELQAVQSQHETTQDEQSLLLFDSGGLLTHGFVPKLHGDFCVVCLHCLGYVVLVFQLVENLVRPWCNDVFNLQAFVFYLA
jgi:hypothetical protein